MEPLQTNRDVYRFLLDKEVLDADVQESLLHRAFALEFLMDRANMMLPRVEELWLVAFRPGPRFDDTDEVHIDLWLNRPAIDKMGYLRDQHGQWCPVFFAQVSVQNFDRREGIKRPWVERFREDIRGRLANAVEEIIDRGEEHRLRRTFHFFCLKRKEEKV